MKRALRFSLLLLALALGACGNPPSGDTPADATYPTRPVTIVVTFPPGGGTDLLARRLGASLQEQFGQPVVVENRPGASGNIGARIVAESPPDGYTLLMVNSSFAINPGVYRNLGFAPRRDFAAVINVAFVPSVFVVPAASPLRTLDDALNAARPERPLAFASCGNGTPQHLAAEMLARASGASLQHVPYKGCGPALTDVASGQVGVGVVTASSAAPLIAAGRLRALAVTSPQRSPLLPAVPTVAEQGVSGYALDQWHGLLAPAATPPAVVAKLNATLTRIMSRPDVQAALREQGFTPATSSPRAFQDMINADIDRYTALTNAIGLRAD
ncbi:tripartite tricarboxylate transporter substrate binding protein [Achromobacter ruhlandii]|uniref:tripartite tricarboxylate transporter substrate binding protein n=1 Tax=Achromobacter ruhlandii TaxID=72557 RepID=UPI0021F17451|nr:tripartite tricarboxylate transporter substrate binding protein [Achromobacter ruhlandii]MCV6796475.1 tripartite tricarboxylate transporter substrate binding protein [Achromobacter ruhlandii]MCV6803210.1 tripartite tricarboxylate transporter substrate binding protein [Achromobacter ruhlandii]MCV6809083.1 tripartite tricarboxylate transporter substrate binding protein [Achromobacter ruhlandii]MCV6820925.1 tripartite tricarboxylate transporter substrate binding protein [Achromobacter ruhlandii